MKANKNNKAVVLMLLLIGGMIFAEGCKTASRPEKCGCGADINGVYKHPKRVVY
jgi:hypothetical protein